MRIEEAAKMTGLSVDTIRFYERIGMLPPLSRDSRGWRRISGNALEWLGNLARLRATGMPMAEMKRFAALVHQAGPVTAAARAERLAILLAHRERLAQRRAEIAAAAAYLDHKISVYSEGAK
ncbi:MAG: MerR family transcriptional regulator [Rhodobacteraceae bacterium]|jgi:MerR family transcriptional regulator, aldehyde-responsive regulator|nr:MerR family transcriptional regulator [Paracoccaceae bacterium]